MELYPARDVKDKKKGKYIGNKKRTRENLGLLLNQMRNLVTQNMEKAELLNIFFASAFTSKTSLQRSQKQEEKCVMRKMMLERSFLVEEDQIRQCLN